MVGQDCPTTIDHAVPGKNKIFLTCDASDWHTGAVLSWGKTWETAQPVAFHSVQLNTAKRNYLVHKKELLVIIHSLKKWQSDLLGLPIFTYTDHQTLENFNTQRDLSRCQLRWQEYLSQYELNMVYVPGEDNTVADALSRVPPNGFPSEKLEVVGAVLKIATDPCLVDAIRNCYMMDKFCVKLTSVTSGMEEVSQVNRLWYVGSRLVIPCTRDVHE